MLVCPRNIPRMNIVYLGWGLLFVRLFELFKTPFYFQGFIPAYLLERYHFPHTRFAIYITLHYLKPTFYCQASEIDFYLEISAKFFIVLPIIFCLTFLKYINVLDIEIPTIPHSIIVISFSTIANSWFQIFFTLDSQPTYYKMAMLNKGCGRIRFIIRSDALSKDQWRLDVAKGLVI